MNTLVIQVQGMKCEGCENRIISTLISIKGISNVKANHKNGTVEVTTEQFDFATIKEKIENLGFSVIDELI